MCAAAHLKPQEGCILPGEFLGIFVELPRHGAGREGFAKFLDRWLIQSTLSNAAFCRITNAILGSNRIHPTQLSGLRNGLCKQISVYTFDALGAIASAAYEHHKKSKAFSADNGELKLIPPFGDTEGAFGPAEIVEMFLGIRPCPELPNEWMGMNWEEESPDILGEIDLGRVVRNVLASQDGDLLDQIDMLVLKYPSKDPKRSSRLKAVILGLEAYTAEELETELLAVCVALGSLTGEKWDLSRLSRKGHARVAG